MYFLQLHVHVNRLITKTECLFNDNNHYTVRIYWCYIFCTHFVFGCIVPFIGETINLALGFSHRQALSLNLNWYGLSSLLTRYIVSFTMVPVVKMIEQ